MSIVLYPLGYLSLEDESGKRLFLRNLLFLFIMVVIISVPFIFLDSNYFGDKGFLDRFGDFAGVLTGFYIAALVGVATFASSVGDLDEEIEIGRIRRPIRSHNSKSTDVEFLTRRQYVCSMFGYLSFVSLFLSVCAIIIVVIAPPLNSLINDYFSQKSKMLITYGVSFLIVIFNVIFSHLFITTCHGLYYLIDRLYAEKPKILPKA